MTGLLQDRPRGKIINLSQCLLVLGYHRRNEGKCASIVSVDVFLEFSTRWHQSPPQSYYRKFWKRKRQMDPDLCCDTKDIFCFEGPVKQTSCPSPTAHWLWQVNIPSKTQHMLIRGLRLVCTYVLLFYTRKYKVLRKHITKFSK